jgi:hypothetical protein
VSEASEVYDPVDLRQRIVVCFTIGELRELAEQLGVAGSVAWQRGIHEAARGVVQQCERYAGLPALVAKLRHARPDMDWPTVSPPAVEPAPPDAAIAPPGDPSASAGASQPTAVEPPAGAAVAASQPPIADPFAPAAPAPTVPGAPLFTPVPPLSGPGAFGPHEPSPKSTASFASPPIDMVKSPPRAPSPVWPGMNEASAAPAQRGLDPRILVAVAAMMLVAAIVAFAAGRASNPSSAEGATAASAAPLGPRGNGPAARAADAIDRRIASLARVCELPPGRDRGELVFARVFDHCGPWTQRRKSPLPDVFDVDAGAPEPKAAEPAAAAPPPTKTRRRNGGTTTAPTEAPPPRSQNCEGKCARAHSSCKTNCGPEPTESGGYQVYQRCLSRCLTDASHCRLACH